MKLTFSISNVFKTTLKEAIPFAVCAGTRWCRKWGRLAFDRRVPWFRTRGKRCSVWSRRGLRRQYLLHLKEAIDELTQKWKRRNERGKRIKPTSFGRRSFELRPQRQQGHITDEQLHIRILRMIGLRIKQIGVIAHFDAEEDEGRTAQHRVDARIDVRSARRLDESYRPIPAIRPAAHTHTRTQSS